MAKAATNTLYVPSPESELHYLNLLLGPLDVCANYKPKFGTDEEEGVSLDQFRMMYGEDPFYHWVGLDSDLMYAAHKAAGGMTSIYRQLGAGCDNLFRTVVKDALLLSDEEVAWSYEVEKEDGTSAILTLDARIDVGHLARRPEAKDRVDDWLKRCGKYLGFSARRIKQLVGAIFEARQGYKSADAKRQNADLRFAMNASTENYLPVLSIISTQASRTVLRRYKNAKMLVMTGTLSDDDMTSTYAFFRNIVRFELDEFFKRNTDAMRKRCQTVLSALLAPA
jgi:hypothetical protein